MVVFNFLAVIVIFPAMIVIDKNRKSRGSDLPCCCKRYILWVPMNPSDPKSPLSDDASYKQLNSGKKCSVIDQKPQFVLNYYMLMGIPII